LNPGLQRLPLITHRRLMDRKIDIIIVFILLDRHKAEERRHVWTEWRRLEHI